MKKTLFVLILWFGVAFSGTQISWNDLQKNIVYWINGPVRLIVTDEEKDTFKKLNTPSEQMQFIKIFWARRDPILRTRLNEFKEEFYRRVAFANEHFAEAKVRGWETARGQVYVIFGPPSREEKRLVAGATRPALLWIYDKRPSARLPTSEALLFFRPENRYILLPPNPEPGDVFGARQRRFDLAFSTQRIPSTVQQAFVDVAHRNVIDEEKDYSKLLFSVETTVKFGVTGIAFDIRKIGSNPMQIKVVMKTEDIPVYDDGERVFAELFFQQELRKNEVVVAENQHVASFDWDQKAFAKMQELAVTLPVLNSQEGNYRLHVTVQDRISNVAEMREFSVGSVTQ